MGDGVEAGSAPSGLLDANESLRARAIQFFARMNDALDFFAQLLDARIRMPPRINERFLVKRPDELANIGQIEQKRTGGNEQPDRQLDGSHVFDKIVCREEIELLAIRNQSGPRREWNERRLQRKILRAKSTENVFEILARVIFGQLFEDAIVYRFHGAGNEKASGAAQSGDVLFVFAEMLDFDGRVVGNLRKLAMKRFDQRNRVADAVEKIGITKGDVLRARKDLPANILKNDFARDDPESAVVNRNDRAMPAEMFAAPGSFGVTGDAVRAIRQMQRGIAIERGEILAIRYLEILTLERDEWFALRKGVIAIVSARTGAGPAMKAGSE